MPWQFLHEIDLPGSFYVTHLRSDERDKLRCQCRARTLPLDRLNYCHSALSHFIVGCADNGHVGNRRMIDELILDLLRIDIDPAGYKHEVLPIRQIQIAIPI